MSLPMDHTHCDSAERAVNAYDKDLFRREDGRIVYASDQVQTRVGIDVSQFQREIDWEAVKNDGVDYAMIRIGGRGIRQWAAL